MSGDNNHLLFLGQSLPFNFTVEILQIIIWILLYPYFYVRHERKFRI